VVTFWSILAILKGSGKINKSKVADPRWLPFKNMTQSLRQMTAPAPVADLKGKSFGRTMSLYVLLP